MAHFTHATATLKADRTVVTEADLAVQALLVDALVQNYPLDGIIAEEEDLRKGSRSGRYWTVDPIDGTVPFVAGLTSWSIALGLLEKCQPVSGYVVRPCLCRLLPFGARPPSLPQRKTHACEESRSAWTAKHAANSYAAAPALRPCTRIPGRVFCLGTASVHLAHVATGGADAVLIGHDKIWDLAPGLALLQAGGGVLRYLDGTNVTMGELLDGKPASLPMLGGHAGAISQVRAHLNYWAPNEV